MTTILHALALLLDLSHCTRWVVSHDRLVCAEVRLDAECIYPGWHETAQGIPVCSSHCGEEGPKS